MNLSVNFLGYRHAVAPMTRHDDFPKLRIKTLTCNVSCYSLMCVMPCTRRARTWTAVVTLTMMTLPWW